MKALVFKDFAPYLGAEKKDQRQVQAHRPLWGLDGPSGRFITWKRLNQAL